VKNLIHENCSGLKSTTETVDQAFARFELKASEHGYKVELKDSLFVSTYFRAHRTEGRPTFVCTKEDNNILVYNRNMDKTRYWDATKRQFDKSHKIMVSVSR
jgi:hypothetical protein